MWTVHYSGVPDTGWWDYEYSDGNSHSLMSLCASTVSPGSGLRGTWRCGWGSKVTVYVNYSFAELPYPTDHGTNDGF